MTKLIKSTVFKANHAKQETTMDKTTRVVRKMVDEDAEKRQVKITRLRNARLEREANTPRQTTPAAQQTRPSKTVKKR